MDKSTINRHVDIPTIYHQLKHHKRHHPSYPPNNNNRTDTPQTNEQEKPTTGGSTQDKANPIRRPQTMKTQHHQMNQSDAPTAYDRRSLWIKKTNHMAQSIITSDEDSKDRVESSRKNLPNPENKDYLTSNYGRITNIKIYIYIYVYIMKHDTVWTNQQ